MLCHVFRHQQYSSVMGMRGMPDSVMLAVEKPYITRHESPKCKIICCSIGYKLYREDNDWYNVINLICCQN